MTTETVSLNADEARKLLDDIKAAVQMTVDLVIEAYQRRAWEAAGYASWEECCKAEFGSMRLRLPRGDRMELVTALRGVGMSVRAIAAATGESKSTVSRELAGVPNGTPETIVGTDGKTYKTERAPDWEADLVRAIDEINARQKAQLVDQIDAIVDTSSDIPELEALMREVQQMSEEWDTSDAEVKHLRAVCDRRLVELEAL